MTKYFFLLIVLSMALAWPPGAASGQSLGSTGEPKRSYGAIDVILYETSWCPYCTKARDFLQGLGVSLVSYDIEKDPERRDEMLAKTGSRGVPVVDIEGTIIRGYSVEAMRSAIERKRRE